MRPILSGQGVAAAENTCPERCYRLEMPVWRGFPADASVWLEGCGTE
jgi:hypothetical protein